MGYHPSWAYPEARGSALRFTLWLSGAGALSGGNVRKAMEAVKIGVMILGRGGKNGSDGVTALE